MTKKLSLAAAAALLAAAGAASAQNYQGYGDRYFDSEEACQEQVRQHIQQNNRGRIDVDFRNRVRKEDVGMGRDRIRGGGFVSRHGDSARFGYECIVNERRERVVTASYEVRGDTSFR